MRDPALPLADLENRLSLPGPAGAFPSRPPGDPAPPIMPPHPTAVDPSPSQVTVFGAAGFIGRVTVEELRRAGWRVRAFVRPSELHPFAASPDVDVTQGDIRDAETVRLALAGSVAVVNLAGAKADEPESEAVNVGGARNLVAAARAAGGVRIVHISTQAVKIARQGIYARTKLAAERVFEASDIPVTILRPSVVYGAGESGVFAAMRRAIVRLPVVPVPGDGRWVSAPVHVADVGKAIVACLVTPATIGRTYDLGGPDRLSMDELLDRMAVHCGRRCRKLHIPFAVALPLARVAVAVLPRAPLSVSNVLGSNQEIPIDIGPARRDFGFEPRSLEEGLRSLERESAGARASRPISSDSGRDVRGCEEAAGHETALTDEARLFAWYLLAGVASSGRTRRLLRLTRRGDAKAGRRVLSPSRPTEDVPARNGVRALSGVRRFFRQSSVESGDSGAFPDLCERYVSAARRLFPAGCDDEVAFVRRHPWALPFLDAACGFFRPRSQLRGRLLLAAALLETTPACAEGFLAPPPSRMPLFFGIAVRGLSSVVKLLAGGVLLPFVRPTCHRIST